VSRKKNSKHIIKCASDNNLVREDDVFIKSLYDSAVGAVNAAYYRSAARFVNYL